MGLRPDENMRDTTPFERAVRKLMDASGSGIDVEAFRKVGMPSARELAMATAHLPPHPYDRKVTKWRN